MQNALCAFVSFGVAGTVCRRAQLRRDTIVQYMFAIDSRVDASMLERIDDNRLCPTREQSRDVRAQDRLAEHRAAEYVSNGAVR